MKLAVSRVSATPRRPRPVASTHPRLVLLSGILFTGLVTPLLAQTSWTGATNGVYATATNWTNGVPSSGTGGANLAIFPENAVGTHTVDLQGTTARNTIGLQFTADGGGGAYIFNSTTGPSPGFQNRATSIAGLTNVAILNDSANTQTFNVPMKNFSSAGGTPSTAQVFLARNGPIIFSGNFSATGKSTVDNNGGLLTIDGNSDITIGIAGAADGVLAGSGGLTKSGSGVLNLGGNLPNTYTGATILNSGTVNANKSNALSNTLLTMNGGILNLNGTAQALIRISGTAGTINLGAGHTLTLTATATATYSGVIAGPGNFVKNGASTQTISGNNTYDGTTTVGTGGRLAAASATALGSTVGNTQIASGGEVLYDGAASNFTVAEAFQVAGVGVSTDGGAITIQNASNITISGAVTLAGDTSLTVAGSATGAYTNSNAITSLANQNLTLQGGAGVGSGGTISGIIALGSGGLTKLQGGKWVLSGANTYTGTTTIGAGTLSVSNIVVSAGASNLGNATSAVVLGTSATTSGTLSYTGTSATFTRGFSVAGTGRIDTTTAGETLTIATGDISTPLGGTGTTGTITFGGAGNTIVTSNILVGTGGVTKADIGSLTLAGANDYLGATAVNVGTMLVTGSIINTSGVTVAGTLGGNGTITPIATGSISVSANGKLSPGTSVGTLSAVLSGGGTFSLVNGTSATNSQSLVFELNTPGASDQISITGGALDIGSSLEFDDFAFTTLGGFGNAATYTLFSGDTAIVGTLGTVIDGTVGGLPAQLQLADSNTDLVLVVVPEPGSATLLLAGLGFLARRRQRR